MTCSGRMALAGRCVVMLVCLAVASCSVLPTGIQVALAPSYHVTVYFHSAVDFYPKSQVQVMGARIGTVDSVTPLADGQVKVVASVERKVPLPADVGAAIVPTSLIGERTLTFAPAWRPGQAKLPANSTIPVTRTQTPVEVDQALASFTNLLKAFNPAAANQILHSAAQSMQGNGTAFNRALQQSADLTSTIAGQDSQLLAVAANLHKLAGVVDGRQADLGRLIDDFSQVSTALAAERKQVTTFVTGLADLVRRGDVIVTKYQDEITGDLGTIAQISLILKGNAHSTSVALHSLMPLMWGFFNSTNHKDHAITIRVGLDSALRGYLAAALRQSTVNPKVPCLPQPYSNCEK